MADDTSATGPPSDPPEGRGAGASAARMAFAQHDVSGLCRIRDERHADAASLALVALQAALLQGERVEDALLSECEQRAARAGRAALVVDAASTRALAALSRGDAETARSHARRSVRMSRTEELPWQQCLAGLALARVRRGDGHPHHALRILGAVQRVCHPAFMGWVEHELRLAGEGSLWPPLPRAMALVELAQAAPSAYLRADLAAARGLLDPEAPRTPDVRAWSRGEIHAVPRGLLALESPTGGHHAVVLVGPGSSVRVLASSRAAEGGDWVCTSRPGRLETALSVLALAPDPLPTETFFEAVYGFVFDPPVHRGSLEVLVHRLRDLLADRAEIDRDRGCLEMRVHRPFVVPDPRVTRSVDDAVLRALAQHPGLTAKESAAQAGVPLRSVQHALRRLVDDGVCEAEKRGRVVCYRVEDTTFSEPTQMLDWARE